MLPIIVQALPNSLQDDIQRFPLHIGSVMMSVSSRGAHEFAPWTGFFVLCGYAAVSLVIGGVLLVRRDV